MALKTLGTNANNSLSAFQVGINDVIAADLGTLNRGIKGDPPGYLGPTGWTGPTSTNRPAIAQAYIKKGILYIPNRGLIQLKDGDWVCFDGTTGWPIVVSGDAATNGPYTHT